MVKCSNFVCLNEVKGGHKYTDAFCKSCRLSSSPFVYECNICKTAFTNNKKSGQIPLSCSYECKRIWRSVLNKAKWIKTHPVKRKKCPSCKKIFSKNTKYCSYNCHGFNRQHIRRVSKCFKKKIPAMTVYLK